jgi:voltage-gated potassium channel
MSGGMAAPYARGRTASRLARRAIIFAVPNDRADIRLPTSDRSPLVRLLVRVAIALGLITFTALVAYVDREGYRDANGTPVGLLDAFYYSTVSVTTTGYGDVIPVTERARLLTTLLITPARILFLIILVGTTLEVLAARTRTHYREKLWRKTLQDHIIVCGYGVKGQVAVATIMAHGNEAATVVVIDERAEAVEEAQRRGHAGIVASASSSATLEAAGIRDAAAVVVAPDRDDTAVLITLTARELNREARIVASVREAENAHLLEQGGADSVVVSSGAAGRLLGHAVHSPKVVTVLEDLLSFGQGLDVIEREVSGDEVGGPLSAVPATAPVIAVVRGEEVLRFDDRRVQQLQAGDRLVCLCSNKG